MSRAPVFDIFRMSPGGAATSIDAAETMHEAQIRMGLEVAGNSLSYRILKSETGERTIVARDEMPA
jgi:hypothetical protein